MDHITFPLHPAQWDVYTDQLLNVESPHYNIGGYIRLRGPLQKDRLREAVCTGPKIFDVFRMRFDTNLSESPCYYDQDYDRCEMPELDFSTESNPEDAAINWMQARFNTAFVIHKDSLLFEHFILKISDDEHWAFGRYHHLIIDGYGFIAWAQYVSLKYKSLVGGEDVEFSYPSYREESKNASAFYKSQEYEDAGRYWKEKITEKPKRLFQKKLFFENKSGKKSSTYTLKFSEQERSELEEIQQLAHGGMQQLTIAALLIYFGKIAEQPAYLIGTPVHKRTSRQLRKTIGMFAGILPFKGNFQKDLKLGEFIREITQAQKRDYRYQQYLIGDLSRHLKLNSTDGYLCEIMVNYELLNFDISFGDEIQAVICRLLNEYELDPLQISWQDYGPKQPLQLQVHFVHEYFSREDVELLVKRILFILRQFPHMLERELAEIDIIPTDEKLLLQHFNNTKISYRPDQTIVDLFYEQARKTPDAPAIIVDDTIVTYRQLDEESNQLAHYLLRLGTRSETLVPVCIERSPRMIVGMLGILKAGGAYVPVDPAYPEDRVSFMLADTNSSIVVSSRYSSARIAGKEGLFVIELDTKWEEISKESTMRPEVSIQPHQMAYVIYTSGSTGRPKGVMIEHRNVYTFVRWCQDEFAWSDFDIVYAGTSICFDLSVYEIFFTLSIGKPFRLLENGLYIDQYLTLDNKVLTNSVPTVVNNLLKEGVDMSNISVMNMAGEPIPFHVQQGLDADRIEIRNLYGPTEDTTYSTVYRLRNDGPILIGRPITNSQVYIVNKEMEILPLGVTGEICIGGAGLARGYLNRAELTAEKFIPNPFSDDAADRLYKTGDLGRWLPDGNIEYQGRADDQVKIRGYRVELGEIETVLEQNELVSEAVVLAHTAKDGTKQLVSYIVPNWKAIKIRERKLYNARIANWQEVYENQYEKADIAGIQDPEFNTNCWNDSFEGGQIANEQMREWLDDFMQLVWTDKPENVLEIGCGTGLIYFQLAGKVNRYIGADFSSASIDYIQSVIAKGKRNYGETSLLVCPAHEIAIHEDEMIDTIILNSVVQYFPGEDYLNEVIAKCISILGGKGRIVIGDVRDNRLLHIFKSRVLLHKLPDSLTIQEFKWAVDQEVLEEQELCFSPEYFYRLQSAFPGITHVEIQWKNCVYENELTLYRYNVVVYVGIYKNFRDLEWQSWKDIKVGTVLSDINEGKVIALKEVPNAKLWKEKALSHALQDDAAADSVEDLVLALQVEDLDTRFVKKILTAAASEGYKQRLLLGADPMKVDLILEKEPSGEFIKLDGNSKGYSASPIYSNVPLFTNISAVLQKDIKSWLQVRLPDYMIPGIIVELDEMPLTPNGKIDKKSLPLPGTGDYITNEYVAPRSAFESKVADIWKEVLEIERVGIHDNFFDLGGHSLKAIQLISRLQKRLHVKTDIAKILANPTIFELTRLLALEKPRALVEIPRLAYQPHYELSHAQKRIWVISYFQDGSTVYNAPGAYIVDGNLNIAALKRSFDLLIERHESLRTVFLLIDNEPRQKILLPADSGFTIKEIDVRGHKNSEHIITEILEKDAQQPFDLENGPLMRVTLFQTATDRYVLGFNIHHIISDGWSKGILIREFLQLYNAVVMDEEIELSPLAIQYKDYAAWHQASYSGQQQYWKDLYEDGVPVLDFPTDQLRPKILSFDGSMVESLVATEIASLLRKKAAKHGTTLNNLLLAAYGLLISKHSRQQDMVIGSLVSGRSHADLESLVGVFINFLPVRLRLSKDLGFSEYLRRSHDTLTAAYSNQDYPFDLMVDNLVKKRDVSRNPFFDTMVNFHSEEDLNQVDNRDANGSSISVRPMKLLKKDFFQSGLDFKLDVEMKGKQLLLNLSYNLKLFSEKRMRDFLAEYIDLLSLIAGNTDFILADFMGPEPDRVEKSLESEENNAPAETLSINICSSFVVEPLQEYIEYWAKELEIDVEVNFAPYNQVFQQLLNSNSILHNNAGINILFVRLDDWLRDHLNLSSGEQIGILDRTYSEFIEAVEYAQKNTVIPFLVSVVPLRPTHSFAPEVAAHIEGLNDSLQRAITKLPRFYLLDLQTVASLYSVDDRFDDMSDQVGHIPFSQEFYAAIGTYIMRKIRAYKGHSYKVIVLDCDNTLWKGVVGEIGALNVGIEGNFSYLQDFILEKYSQGFLIALCSKNNEEDVWEVFDQHPGMKLKREHIAAHRINWNPKPGNLVEIAQELNLGLNSLVFIDDSEFEIGQVTTGCPDVLSLALPEDEPGSFAAFINHIWALDHFQVTEEDMKRNSMYKAEKQRKEEQVKFSSLDDFLQSLDIKVKIRPLEEADLERAVQLTLRTNQFNLNGIRKSPEEIARSTRQENHINWIIEVKDRFGDYGITGLLLARKSQQTLILETFLLSCRVLGRNVENIILNELKNYCIVHGLDTVMALYQQTAKNKPISNFLVSSNWHLDSQTNNYSLFVKSSEPELLAK